MSDSARILQASLDLSATLLEAVDESSILRAIMRTGCEVLGAEGCVFTPFDEFSIRRPVMEFGNLPWGDPNRLSQPEVRQKCKNCKTRSAGGDCILLRDRLDDRYIYCVPLKEHGREAGLFSFIFSSKISIEEPLKRFVLESIHLAELALDRMERNRLVHSMQYNGDLISTSPEIQSLLPNLEYQAILGERTRLAREIHDGLAQSLAYLKIVIGQAESMLSQGKSGQVADILKVSSHTINDIYLDAREAIENLRRPADHLETWLCQVVEDFEATSGLPVELEIQVGEDPAPNVQAQLIRIVQEALTNVRKHADAERVKVQVRQEDKFVFIKVEDDGRGFDPAGNILQSRFGLRGMRERVEAIGAELNITSHPGEGTSISVQVPIRSGGNL